MLLAARGSYSRARQVISETIRRLQLLPDSVFALIQFSLYACSASWLTGDLDEAVEYSAGGGTWCKRYWTARRRDDTDTRISS